MTHSQKVWRLSVAGVAVLVIVVCLVSAVLS